MSRAQRRRSPPALPAARLTAEEVYDAITGMSPAEVAHLCERLSLTPLPGFAVARDDGLKSPAGPQEESGDVRALRERLARFDRSKGRDRLFSALRRQKEQHSDWVMQRHLDALRPLYPTALAAIKSPKSLSRAYTRWLRKQAGEPNS